MAFPSIQILIGLGSNSKTCVFSTSVILVSLLLVVPARADVVTIESGIGNGFMFEARGKCILLLPQHVRQEIKDPPLSSIGFSGLGVSGKAGFLYSSEEKDIALMTVQDFRGTNPDCNEHTWQDLLDIDVKRLISTTLGGASAKLLYRDSAGNLLDEKVTDISRSKKRGPDFLEGKVDTAFAGMSGSTINVGGQIIGLTLRADREPDAFGKTNVVILRFDTIRAAIKPEIEKLSPLLQPAPPVKGSSLTEKAKKYWWIPVATGVAYLLISNGNDPPSDEPGVPFNLTARFPQPD